MAECFSSLNDALDALDDDELSHFRQPVVTMIPPIEDPQADTDVDSDLSDDDVEGEPTHLPKRVLRSQAEIIDVDNAVDDDESDYVDSSEEEEPEQASSSRKRTKRGERKRQPAKKKKVYKWTKSSRNFGSKVPALSDEETPLEDNKTPLQLFELFFSQELVEHIVTESKSYAQQKGLSVDEITAENIKVFVGILLLSGYNRLPNTRMYWEEKPDVHNAFVSQHMRRDTFLHIMRTLHFRDNNLNDGTDRFYKVRPLFDHLNRVFKGHSIPSKCFSVDESIVPYYGSHPMKQFIRGKPLRFGYKLWIMALSCGYILHCEPYCGKDTKIEDRGLGQGSNVVLDLLEKCNLPQGSQVFFDNLFTSVPLLGELSERGIGGTGTLRENRFAGAPLSSKKVMDKKSRGDSEEVFCEDLSCVRWKDNKPVAVLSNVYRKDPLGNVKRWVKEEKKTRNVGIPNSILQYNKYMGGVDQGDQKLSQLRIKIRSKKWYWALFSWSLSSCALNAWYRYRACGKSVTYLDFVRSIVQQILTTYGTQRNRAGRRPALSTGPDNPARFDGKDHWLIHDGGSQRNRCRNCNGRTPFACTKCQVPLHPVCHFSFHVPQ